MKDPCGPCGLCCRSYLVPLFGHDLWWITTRLNLAPQSFVFVAEQETPDALGFRLVPDGPTHGLALLKREPLAADQPCIFLVDAGAGHTRCGIYDDRPITCRVYPMSKLGARIYQRPQTLCPPGSWDDSDVIAPHWMRNLQRLRYRRDIYVEVIARWNAAVQQFRPPDPLPPSMFCSYLVAVYGKIAAIEEVAGAAEMERIELSWATVAPRRASEEASVLEARRDAEPGWISFFRNVRGTIDEFFPELPPQPFQPLVVES